ncbi:response regulator transcription factor [Amycolatopsis sp. PS_44_ISF1]|uniref:response regulator transcription factor n=1 Tax=Amycolatopsis sp. PS_44_ISF1 TaxID=2974917 RepID=UPI0028DE0216|nr:response regulator transcription factor [Amycolatopsis sp. PS_44_ISF1]MDT8914992.1 response regulator transcription factor [Amycolatopsis sp. PS_44_ISF1]
MGARILVAEDDAKQSKLIRAYLEREGHSVLIAPDGRLALELSRARGPDLVVLDVMLPEVDGLDVCRVLRTESVVPILMLTARSTEPDLLLGLDLGADDYLTKPYSPRELTARVRALLRRAGAERPAAGPIRVLDVEIDPDRFEVRVAGRLIGLTAKEFELLRVLAAEPGRAFTRAQLIDRAFGFEQQVQERTIDAHVMNVRRKIEAAPSHPKYVLTVPGRGYRFAEDS